MKYDRRAGLLFFTLGVLLVSTGASWPLNPLVTRNPQPPATVPVECEQGLAPSPLPRVNVAEIPAREEILPAVVPAAPPSRTLRHTLEEAHTALTRNDRPAFDAALASARLIVRDYPPGSERANAEEALRAYDDASFLWDAQFVSPFFDQNSEAYARASRYPGYAEAVRRGVLTDDADRRFFPASESRAFLASVASKRLERLGIRTPAPPTRIARAERPRSTPQSVSAPAPRRTTPRRAATNTKSRKSATSAISAPASPDPPAPSRAVTESAPAAPPAAAPTPAADPASPAAEGQPVDDVPEPVTETASDTAITTPAPSLPPPPAAPAPASPARGRSVVVPALLIAIGLGVLFVLFRVSK